MKTLTKLALVSAVAISGHAFALQSLNDTDLSATTGQDGITIKLDAQADGTIFGANDVVIHDKDGVGSGNYGVTTSGAGAIVLGKKADGTGTGFSMQGVTGDSVIIKVDADANTSAPVLNINVGLPKKLTVNTGDIYVAKSGGIAAASSSQFSSESKILDNLSIVIGDGVNTGATMNIQLGSAPQGAMIKLGGTVTGGVNIDNLTLTDNSANAGGVIKISRINVSDQGGADLALSTNVKVIPAGLSIIRDSTLPNGGNIDVRLTGLQLGTADTSHTLGDIAILGMSVPNMTISGH